MLVNRKPSGRASGFPAGLAIGTFVSMLLTAALAAILALLVSRETVAEKDLGYGVMLILFLSSALGSTVAYAKIRHRRLLVFALSGLCYLVTMTALTALFFGGQFEGIFPTAMLIIGSSGMAFLFPGRRNDAGKHRKISKQFR